MKMVNMRVRKVDKEELEPVSYDGASESRPKYPWGLKLNLGTDELDALKFKIEKHRAGETGELTAKFYIESIRSSDSVGREEKEVVLQITDLALKEPEDKLVVESGR